MLHPLRLLVLTIATIATGMALWIVLFLLALYVFDEPTPECTGSDTCGAWGDFAYHVWPGGFVSFLVGGVVSWFLIRLAAHRSGKR